MLAHDESQPCVFNVQKSASGRAWKNRLDAEDVRLAAMIAQRNGLPDMVSRVLAARGVTADNVEQFWAPSLKTDLPDPSTLTDMNRTADRIAQAVQNREKIAIFGDYDVDGATSTALMVRFLNALGLQPITHIPDRLTEGYGPSVPVLRGFADKGASLIICLDCGATSTEAIMAGGEAGADVLVVDHHQVGDELPPAYAMVNPNRQDDLSGQGHLAAVGVTFLVCVAVNRALRERGFYNGSMTAPDLRMFLDLVALGTVCDVVPLTGVNRAFVIKGLLAVGKGWNPGLQALCQVSRQFGAASAYQLGFMLGPRINAGGRIGKSSLGLELLTNEDPGRLEALAQELDRLNTERQALEAMALDQAMAMIDGRAEEQTRPVVVASADWHPGIVGLIASRICERTRLPCVAIAIRENGEGTGSARSVSGFDLGASVRRAVDDGMLIKGGGHEMAAGLTIDPDNIPRFSEYLNTSFSENASNLRGNDLKIDGPMTAGGATLDVIKLLEKAGPFGAGHPSPIFAFPAHRITYAEPVGKAHIRCQIATDSGDRLSGIAFRALGRPLGELLLSHTRGAPLHLCGTLSINSFRGENTPQLSILDAAIPAHRS